MGTSLLSASIPASRAIAKMRSPYEMGIICVDVTNKCDLACSNCTRLLANQDTFWEMSPENFRLALRGLDGYPGLIAMIGGNPPIHRHFKELCRIFVEETPNKAQRGLWTNNIFKHEEIALETFGGFNINPHGVERGIRSLENIRAKSLGDYHSGHSHHSPLLTAVKDIFPDEEEMWEHISNCDVNKYWSATVVQVNGKLRAYFCEVAASFDLARGGDHGIEVVPGWWQRPITDFADQVQRFCPGCGVPARQVGHMDFEEIDTYTESNADIAEKAQKSGRKIVRLDPAEYRPLVYHFTQYSETTKTGPASSGARDQETPRPWIKPAAEFCLTFGRMLNSGSLTNLGERLWRL
ncbi:hypothetical+protein [Methylocapsa aurea]|uniref:radical SAM protein n=1 Tax=Methylocapsa aurea TaxID=663610 RepID=UPI003D18D025